MFSGMVQVVAVVLVAMVLSQTDAYSRSRTSRYSTPGRRTSSFYDRYGSGSRYRSPRARYVHSYSSHPHPHPPQAIGIPINLGDDHDLADDVELVNRFLPYGYGDSLLGPITGLLRDLAGYTGYSQTAVPNLVRNIKHEFYIGANKRDPLLHSILKRYGFMFTGNPSDLGIGMSNGQNGISNLFNTLGLGGGAYGGGTGNGLVSSAQNPLPGMTNGITDDLFDDFGNGLLAARTSDSNSKIAQPSPNVGTDLTSLATSPGVGLF